MSSETETSTTKRDDTTKDTLQSFRDLARKLVNVPKEEVDAIDPLVQKKKKQKPAKQGK